MDLRELAANKGVVNGYASLDINARVPISQLPFTNKFKTNNNVAFYMGIDGRMCGEFGTNKYLEYNTLPYTITNSTCSFAAWVFLRSIGASSSVILLAGETTAGANDISFYITPDRKIGLSSVINNANSGQLSSGTIPLNTWTHVAVTSDASFQVIYYINGAVNATTTTNTPITTSTKTVLLSGTNRALNNFYLDGFMQDVKFFTYKISSGDVTSLASASNNLLCFP